MTAPLTGHALRRHLGQTTHATTEVKQLGLARSAESTVVFNWADPLIGIQTEVPIVDRTSRAFRGDIGGFGASSNLIWGLAGDVRYWMEWNPKGARPWVALGYRAAAFDRSSGGADVEMQFRGPAVALGTAF